ncbi:unnamed protein product [Brugia pahangi]|uniref:MIP-T3_C domain-containing protein n=1 Tax=Brugia pahangi TaxID=6280 RepID=A0A0N4TD96_BRUPA|nr:unnamed protein product [Brugia pahangi]
MSALLDKKEQTIDAIINEKKAIEVERNCLQQQVDNLKQQCHNLSPFATNISHKGENETELMIRLCEKDDQLQQFTTEIAEKVEEITYVF